MSGEHWGAGRECRDSGTSQGIGASGGVGVSGYIGRLAGNVRAQG